MKLKWDPLTSDKAEQMSITNKEQNRLSESLTPSNLETSFVPHSPVWGLRTSRMCADIEEKMQNRIEVLSRDQSRRQGPRSIRS